LQLSTKGPFAGRSLNYQPFDPLLPNDDPVHPVTAIAICEAKLDASVKIDFVEVDDIFGYDKLVAAVVSDLRPLTSEPRNVRAKAAARS
jgi:hypothetical protein